MPSCTRLWDGCVTPASPTHRPLRIVGPVRRKQQQIRPHQRQDPRCFGEAAIEADADTDAKATQVVNAERLIARIDEAIESDTGEMDLPIAGDRPIGPDDGASVEDAIAILLQEPEDDPEIVPTGHGSDRIRGGAGDRLGQFHRGSSTRCAVSGEGTLGKDDESSAEISRLLETAHDRARA